ncbi:hypothetical protein PHMEG_00021267 [Phytophthora megakarya]|uniref:Uncharacterized protein n=1 Tax=Phytophthora megakarya TaxID=4795 RepID=A0A225VMB1_9STRA|nr:hypothetical protein PHMEG_00021267 [Phytophthora megakarya]
MQDYAFNANKRCPVKYSSGRGKQYACDSSVCMWEVRVTNLICEGWFISVDKPI